MWHKNYVVHILDTISILILHLFVCKCIKSISTNVLTIGGLEATKHLGFEIVPVCLVEVDNSVLSISGMPEVLASIARWVMSF